MFDVTSAKLSGGLLCLEVPVYQAHEWLSVFKPGKYDMEPHREKRSKDANALCWALCTEIGEAIRKEKESVYRDAIKNMSVYKDFTLTESEALTFRAAWGKLGTGWVTEQVDYAPDGDHVIIRAYYGSSTYNTKQMSRLIDILIEDARSVGVATPDDERIRSLLTDWEEKHAK